MRFCVCVCVYLLAKNMKLLAALQKITPNYHRISSEAREKFFAVNLCIFNASSLSLRKT